MFVSPQVALDQHAERLAAHLCRVVAAEQGSSLPSRPERYALRNDGDFSLTLKVSTPN